MANATLVADYEEYPDYGQEAWMHNVDFIENPEFPDEPFFYYEEEF